MRASRLIGCCFTALLTSMSSYFTAVTVFRLDRSPELIQLMNDLVWISQIMNVQGIIIQEIAFSYGVLQDTSPNPLYPHWLAYVMGASMIFSFPPMALHCAKTGVLAWDGAISFWIPSIILGNNVSAMALYTYKAACRTDILADGETAASSESEL